MRKCNSCGNPIGNNAKRCPKCGEPHNTQGQNSFFTIILIGFVIFWIYNQFLK